MEKKTSTTPSEHPLTLLEERLKALRTAIDEGLESGPAEPFDVEAFIAEKNRERKRA